VLYGEPGSGKTWVAVDIAMHVATARRWHWERHNGGPKLDDECTPAREVIYYSEVPDALAKKRVKPWCERYGVELASVPFRVLKTPPDIANPARVTELIDTLRQQGARPGVIVIDTVARVMDYSGLDEDNKGFGRLVTACDMLRDAFGCAVVLVHHTAVANSGRPRGGGALTGGNGAEVRMVENTISQQNLEKGRALVAYQSVRMQNSERDDAMRTFRAEPQDEGVVLLPIPLATFNRLLPLAKAGAGADITGPAAIKQHQIRQAFRQAGDPEEIAGPALSRFWVEADEKEHATLDMIARSENQMKTDAEKWYRELKSLTRDGKLDAFLAREPDGQPKRGERSVYLYVVPPADDEWQVE
jgi:RecA-family ATPase